MATQYIVKLSNPGPKVIDTLKRIKAATGCRLVEAKDMTDIANSPIKLCLTQDEANETVRQIEGEGAICYIERVVDNSISTEYGHIGRRLV